LQLSIAQGMVRCGKCREVFNAMLNLVDSARKPQDQQVVTPPSSFVTLTKSQELTQSQELRLQAEPVEAMTPSQPMRAVRDPLMQPEPRWQDEFTKIIGTLRAKGKRKFNMLLEKVKQLLGSENNLLFTDVDQLQKSQQALTGTVVHAQVPRKATATVTGEGGQSGSSVIDYKQALERKSKADPAKQKTEKSPIEQQTQSVLNMLVNDVENPWLRAAAVRGLDDQSVLSEVAINDTRAIVRLAAVEKITSKALLASVAKTDPDEMVRNTALRKLNLKKIV